MPPRRSLRRLVPESPTSLEARRLLAPVVALDVIYRRDGDRPERLDYYLPRSAAPEGGRPVLLAIHGGGWRRFDKSEYGRSLLGFTKAGFAVVSVNYTLSKPGRPSFPENLDDARAAIRWVRNNAARLGLDPERIALIGESAGGHLAALAGFAQEDSDDGAAKVAAVVAFYPPTDLARLVVQSPGAIPAVFQYLGGPPASVPENYRAASPVTHVSADDPPVLLIHGDRDALVPVEQSKILADAVVSVGGRAQIITVSGEGHGFRLQIGRKSLFPNILAFLRTTWNDIRDGPRTSRLSDRIGIDRLRVR